VVQKHEAIGTPAGASLFEGRPVGFAELIDRKYSGYAFRFFLIEILTSLRAVQHALRKHDRSTSLLHGKVIDEWWNDPKTIASAEWSFIKTSRDRILKIGFQADATHIPSAIGKGPTYKVTGESYELAYNTNGEKGHRMVGSRTCEH
jgi:hypothetical protein